MRVFLPGRRPAPPPNVVERLLGRERARWLRRRTGLAAMAVGWKLLKPQPRHWRVRLGTIGSGAAVLTALVLVAVRTG